MNGVNDILTTTSPSNIPLCFALTAIYIFEFALSGKRANSLSGCGFLTQNFFSTFGLFSALVVGPLFFVLGCASPCMFFVGCNKVFLYDFLFLLFFLNIFLFFWPVIFPPVCASLPKNEDFFDIHGTLASAYLLYT